MTDEPLVPWKEIAAQSIDHTEALEAERDALRAALDMIYNAEGDHPVCGCPVHKAIFDAWAKHGV